jgi:type I restriction enzyme M protein
MNLIETEAKDKNPSFSRKEIAENIGYDATGRETQNNELIEISKELSKFIAHIDETER